MDLRQLRVLRELGERGSVAAVASALYVTPSAVSQHLSALQRSTGVVLTERRGRTLALTQAGQALAGAAVEVSTAMAAAEEAVAHFRADAHTPVTVSAFHSAGLSWFGPLLARLKDGPPVHFFDEDIAQQGFPALVADHDIVIAHRVPHDPAWPASLAVTPLLDEPFDLAVSLDHPLATRKSVRVADAAGLPWISGHAGYPLGEAVKVVAAAAGRPLEIVHRINEFFVARSIVAAGAAVALMPRHTMTTEGIVLLPFADLTVGRRIDALCRPETMLRASVRTVLDALAEVAV